MPAHDMGHKDGVRAAIGCAARPPPTVADEPCSPQHVGVAGVRVDRDHELGTRTVATISARGTKSKTSWRLTPSSIRTRTSRGPETSQSPSRNLPPAAGWRTPRRPVPGPACDPWRPVSDQVPYRARCPGVQRPCARRTSGDVAAAASERGRRPAYRVAGRRLRRRDRLRPRPSLEVQRLTARLAQSEPGGTRSGRPDTFTGQKPAGPWRRVPTSAAPHQDGWQR